MKGKKFKPEDYDFVFGWMRGNCYGREDARFRENEAHSDLGILPYMPGRITDRKFRYIISAMVHEGIVYSSAAWGYFFMPLQPKAYDIEAANRALDERETKALSALEKISGLRKKLAELGQGARDLFQA